MPDQRPFDVLVVCTGNICRSALAERLGRAYLDEVLGEAASAIRLTSAGTHAVVGSAMDPNSALVLRGLGGDSDGFHAHQLIEAHVTEAHLILTMTRAHRRDVLSLAPRAMSRTFTLREAAALVELLGQDIELGGLTPADRGSSIVDAMGGARSRRRSGEEDDIPDPIGRPVDVHEEVGEMIATALVSLLGRLAAVAEGPGLRSSA